MGDMLNTLKYFDRLRQAGLGETVARAIAEGQYEAMVGSVALKSDLALASAELRAEMQRMRVEVKAEIQDLRTELKAEIQGVRTDVQRLRADVGHLSGWMKGMYVYVALALALMAALAHWRLI